eukprot:8735440-Pyramimonas_sp.AAC.1
MHRHPRGRVHSKMPSVPATLKLKCMHRRCADDAFADPAVASESPTVAKGESASRVGESASHVDESPPPSQNLVDISEGKERHVPYRDSKLTFLLKV